jgi:hypothetical protein
MIDLDQEEFLSGLSLGQSVIFGIPPLFIFRRMGEIYFDREEISSASIRALFTAAGLPVSYGPISI